MQAGVTVTASSPNNMYKSIDNNLDACYFLSSVVAGQTYVQYDFGISTDVGTVMIHDRYGHRVQATIDIWVTDTAYDPTIHNGVTDWIDSSKHCYTGSRYGVMHCQGKGRYMIIRAVQAGPWEFYEVLAFTEESLEIDTAAVSITGMTADSANYADRLTGNFFQKSANFVAFTPTGGVDSKLTLPLID